MLETPVTEKTSIKQPAWYVLLRILLGIILFWKGIVFIRDTELLKIHLDRLKACKKIDQIIVATTINEEDNVILSLCKKWGVEVSRGSVNDVLDRYYQVAKLIRPEWIVRVTSDCPLIDPNLVDTVISFAHINDVDYCSNFIVENFPDGQDVEIFKFAALEVAWNAAKLKSEREHVTPYIRKHSGHSSDNLFTSINFPCANDYSAIRMTVDEPSDFELVKKIVHELGVNESWLTYSNYIIKNKLSKINEHIIRNEGLLKSLKND